MILDWIREVGPWSWMVLGVILLALEIVVPGVFLLWIGVAAILTGALSLQLWGWESWIWQVQVLVFLALSLAAVFVGRRIMRSRGDDSDQPLLNRRAEQLVGRTATLSEAIVEGRGRVRLGDTIWRISGPDLPVGARVRVTSVADGTLIVEPA
jgi:inner membrane protein